MKSPVDKSPVDKPAIDKAIELLSELGDRRPALEQLRRAKEVIYELKRPTPSNKTPRNFREIVEAMKTPPPNEEDALESFKAVRALLDEARLELSYHLAQVRLTEDVLAFEERDLPPTGDWRDCFYLRIHYPCRITRLEIDPFVASRVDVHRFSLGSLCLFSSSSPIHGDVFSSRNRRWAPVTLDNRANAGAEIRLDVKNLSCEVLKFKGAIVVVR
jgi:hypothetical protein